ncbi:MerR family transcriptional regulator [Rhizorhabdus dicambivorans]|uniref:MerR family transcriptional regulator n=1 Tax=Rhizorhabdus dicambivorans TaxID=1850238 RepID=A0A2A4FXQ9_9SPHN|nr:MerR family DNA-binding transcriptional regulator [Rhizorhabdus dicambivorans]ATE66935.1 MerR family transcriptional regulator [Rhizorhabdus dicambivorans]PCE42193.1 MerR family transcriptional regulator [Rhizorhabdus dicambivorans]
MTKHDPSGGDRQPLRSIQDVADELGITSRAIRFYEDKGLLEPQRVGTMRVYSKREVGRLQLILRGKRLGFSLREIKEFLDLYTVDELHLEQTKRLLAQTSERIDALELQRHALEQTLDELKDIVRQCRERIAEAG